MSEEVLHICVGCGCQLMFEVFGAPSNKPQGRQTNESMSTGAARWCHKNNNNNSYWSSRYSTGLSEALRLNNRRSTREHRQKTVLHHCPNAGTMCSWIQLAECSSGMTNKNSSKDREAHICIALDRLQQVVDIK